MREIKFRGKSLQTNNWVYGSLVQYGGKLYIYVSRMGEYDDFEVDPATVGQFAGQHEKLGGEGKEIWEGDRVLVDVLGINYSSDKMTGVVEYVDGCFTVVFSEPVYDIHDKCYRRSLYVKCFVVNRAIKVIGTKYDDPELLVPVVEKEAEANDGR